MIFNLQKATQLFSFPFSLNILANSYKSDLIEKKRLKQLQSFLKVTEG